MSQRRRFARLAALTVTVSVAAAALTSPAYAALANIDIGGGTVVDNHARAATPTQVSPGNVAGFYLWVRNEDTAGLPTFFMNAVSTATPLGAYWTNDPVNGPFNPCFIDGTLQCSFGGIDAGESIFITAAFTLSTGTSTSTANCKPSNGAGFGPSAADGSWRCVDFAFAASQGNVPGKNKSRGDIYHWYDYVSTNTGSDSAGQFPFCDRSDAVPDCDTNLLTVLNSTGANKNNVQSTKLVAPEGAFNSSHGTTGLAVADNFAFICPTTVAGCSHEGDDFLGQWSRIDVNSEQTFGSDFEDLIHTTLTMYAVNANQVDGVVHIWQDATGAWQERDITTECPSANGPNPEAPPPAVECFWASGSGNTAVVDVWSFNNGYHRTF